MNGAGILDWEPPAETPHDLYSFGSRWEWFADTIENDARLGKLADSVTKYTDVGTKRALQQVLDRYARFLDAKRRMLLRQGRRDDALKIARKIQLQKRISKGLNAPTYDRRFDN